MKKIFAVLLTVALFATNAVIVLANDYEDANEEYDYGYAYDEPEYVYAEEEDYEDVVFPEAYRIWWIPDWDREFDNLLDELVFRRFGEGSDFLFEFVTEIGQTFTVGRFEIEVVGSIAFEGRRFDRAMWHWPEETVFYWDEETGEMNMLNMPDEAVRDESYVTEVETHVFVAIRDLTGELDKQMGGSLVLAHI